MLAKVRFTIGFGSFVFFLAFFAGPLLYALILWDWLFNVDIRSHRLRTSTWLTFFAWLTHTWVRPIFGVNFLLELPEEFTQHPERPFLIVVNHQNIFDIYFLNALMGKLRRRRVCWIVKKAIRRVPWIGLSAFESGSAFVDRNGDFEDQEKVRACGRNAHSDKSNVILFAEGTRFRQPRPDSGFTRVLPPKTRGFEILREELTDHPVLSATLDWQDMPGQTLLQGASVIGRTFHVRARVVHDLGGLSAAEWLHQEWLRKDHELLEMRSHLRAK